MDVSHFELADKPQSPAAPTGAGPVDSLIQGFFLGIGDLEDTEYRCRVELVAAPVTDPLRSLAGNAVVFVDTPGADNQQGMLNGAITATSFFPTTGFVTVPAKGTALIAVLPSAFGPLPGETTPPASPDVEVRGSVRLTLPPLVQVTPGTPFPRFRFVPQSDRPARVMLTPQNRTTYVTAAGAISDQTQASLPPASSTAVNALASESGLLTFPFATARLPEVARALETMAPDVVALLGAMLGDEAARTPETGRG
jgi:hypothetical protein